MAGPSPNYAVEGKDLSGTTLFNAGLAANATATATITVAAAFSGWTGIKATTTSSVSATNGIQVAAYPQRDAAGDFDTVAITGYSSGNIAPSTTFAKSLFLAPGTYQIKVTNLDTGQALSAVSITSSLVS